MDYRSIENEKRHHHYVAKEFTDSDYHNFISAARKQDNHLIIGIKGIAIGIIEFFIIGFSQPYAGLFQTSDETNILVSYLFMALQFILFNPLLLPTLTFIIYLIKMLIAMYMKKAEDYDHDFIAHYLLNGVVKEMKKTGMYCESIGTKGSVMQVYPIEYNDDMLDEIAIFLTDTAKSYQKSLPFIGYIMNCIRDKSDFTMAKGIVYAEVVKDQLELGNENILYPTNNNLENYVFYANDPYNVTDTIENM